MRKVKEPESHESLSHSAFANSTDSASRTICASLLPDTAFARLSAENMLTESSREFQGHNT